MRPDSLSFLIRAWRPLAYLLKGLEQKRVKAYRQDGEGIPPIFILGPPRCGSTLTYQLITENFLLEYFDNLTHALYRTPFIANQLSHFFFDDKSHGSFRSKGGYTLEDGWHAPSECPPYWYRAIPKDLHPVRGKDLDEEDKRLLRDPIRAIMGLRERSLIVKNLFMVERLDLVKTIFPDARFLIVKRDRLRTARSIIRERKRFRVEEKKWWSARPTNYEELEELPLTERVAGQVHYLETDVEEGLKDIPQDRRTYLRYDDLLKDPKGVLAFLQNGILSDVQLRKERWTLPPALPTQEAPMEELEWIEKGFRKLGLPYG